MNQQNNDLNSAVCPVSNSTNTKPLCQVGPYKIFRCPDSGTDFVWPMPKQESLTKLYDQAEWFNGGLHGGYSNYDEQTQGSLETLEKLLQRFENNGKGLSILDVGCGYGSHLKIALDFGWQCTGIEPSKHAREIASERYGNSLTIVEEARDLMPQKFDLILMLDVIEHLTEPYQLFFTLFGKGAIEPDTLIFISTPNARSTNAIISPENWTYRHPPSHLVFYSAKSFEIIAKHLLFTEIKVSGEIHENATEIKQYHDESNRKNDNLSQFQALTIELKGSSFKNFMHERYVPGGFWKLTEYEHIPRYSFASLFTKGANVLDFGCGTGYGSLKLSLNARSVLGIDISSDAVEWATHMHCNTNTHLRFERRSDLAAGLPSQSFDIITNFEMIEHVDHDMQIKTIQSFSRLLKNDGKLIISTPDPSYTEPYGDNPYHIREMDEESFVELLSPFFKYIKMLKQWVRPCISIGEFSTPEKEQLTHFGRLGDEGNSESLVGYVAICSHTPFKDPMYFCQYDTKDDFNRNTLKKEILNNQHNLKIQQLSKEKKLLEEENQQYQTMMEDTRRWVTTLEEQKKLLEEENQQYQTMIEDTRRWVTTLEEQKQLLDERKQQSTSVELEEKNQKNLTNK